MPPGDLNSKILILRLIKKLGIDDWKSTFITLKTIKAFQTLMQLYFNMQWFRLEAIIFKKLSQKVRMPVTEHNSTLKITVLMRKYCKKTLLL